MHQSWVVASAGGGLEPAADRAWVLSEEHGNVCYIVAEVLDRGNRERFSRCRDVDGT